MDSLRFRCILVVATLILCAPLAAEPTVDTNNVTITYTGSAAATTGTVNITNGANISVRISSNVDGNGNSVSAGPGLSASGVFIANASNAAAFVGTDPSVLGNLARRGVGSYTGTMLISGTGCNDCISVTLTLNITNGQVGVLWNGVAVPSTGIVLNAGFSQSVTTSIALTSSSTTSYSLNSNVTWLTFSPQTGSVGPGASPQSPSITLFANATNLPTGVNTATVTVGASGTTAATFTVTLNVGTSTGATASPNPLSFTYVTSTASFTTGQTQFVTISGPSSSSTYSATSNQSWLLLNGGVSVANVSILQQLQVSVNVAALGTTPTTYQGVITIQTSDVGTILENVNLTITNTGTTGSTNLTFNVPSVGGSAPSQSVTISGTGSFWLLPTAVPTVSAERAGCRFLPTTASSRPIPLPSRYPCFRALSRPPLAPGPSASPPRAFCKMAPVS